MYKLYGFHAVVCIVGRGDILIFYTDNHSLLKCSVTKTKYFVILCDYQFSGTYYYSRCQLSGDYQKNILKTNDRTRVNFLSI